VDRKVLLVSSNWSTAIITVNIIYYNLKYNVMVLPKDATGKRFGRLVAIRRVENYKDGRARWLCKCDCGKETTVIYSSMASGNTISCGCALTEALTKHNQSKTNFYKVWLSMKTRCNNPKSNRFAYYGGKGIKYDPRWDAFNNFYEDMYEGYQEGLTLDRLDSSKNYSKENCRWVGYVAQNNNKSDNIKLKYNGIVYSPKDASLKFSIPLCMVYNRRRRGWSDKRIIETPPQSKYSSK